MTMHFSKWKRTRRTASSLCELFCPSMSIFQFTKFQSRGNFADSFGEDFLGLRELGIAAEFGLSSLTVPKRLLKGKNKGNLQQTPEFVFAYFIMWIGLTHDYNLSIARSHQNHRLHFLRLLHLFNSTQRRWTTRLACSNHSISSVYLHSPSLHHQYHRYPSQCLDSQLPQIHLGPQLIIQPKRPIIHWSHCQTIPLLESTQSSAHWARSSRREPPRTLPRRKRFLQRPKG